jgi:phenylacetate-CoA ligase
VEPLRRPTDRHPASTSGATAPATEERLLAAVRRAAAMPWYRTLLAERGVAVDRVRDAASFAARCPLLDKSNTFDRFALDELAATTDFAAVESVLTSSGHGGRFSFGLNPRGHATAAAQFVDDALDAAFQVKSRSTLTINCLPMGVGFPSACTTVATTSVREDMAVALLDAFGKHYDQIVLVADPLFLKRLTDYSASRGADWRRHRMNVVIGEEIFGERFRGYVAGRLGLDLDRPEDGYIMSSFGVGELGLHLCYETPATIALRRAAPADASLAGALFGAVDQSMPPPMVFTFNPLRTFVEVVDPDASGFGRLTISMLDPSQPIPLLRYQTGDEARLLDRESAAELLRAVNPSLAGDLPPALVALRGRSKEVLPNGSHVGIYKDALYADPQIADGISGAFRVVFAGTSCTLHVQCAAGTRPPDGRALLDALPPAARPKDVVFWPYDRFPFGMTVDYERKFAYYVPGSTPSR